ncbi:MAG TPA: SpoIID/LytB domain-containing protein [Gaiellaceae bacterium]|nr:SpoIID/LytB domain-containing protein [Gaiellaceae bacterium]
MRSPARLAALALLLGGGLAGGLALPSRAGPGQTTTAPTSPATTTLAARGVLALTGHGWGHGIGMSQWGAYGYAQHGWTYDRILAHYYPGTTLGAAPTRTIRVLVAAARRVTLGAGAAWRVRDAAGTTVRLDPARPLVLGPALRVDGKALRPPLLFTSPQPLAVDGAAYRGRLVVARAGRALQVVDAVPLEAYVKGVVPEEMPSNWAPQALEAQAVATRSYALANLVRGGTFDVYGDERSQIYGGVAAETPTASAAVDATRGRVVLYDGKVADTMFFSTSGGRTASAAEATGRAVPYLVSVPDPYDGLSPYHDWGPVLLDLSRVAKRLKLSAPIDDLQAATGPSGRVTLATVIAGGETRTFTGTQLRTLLGLRSTWFTPTLLELLPPPKPVAYGGAGSLGGFVRGAAADVSLEARPAGGDWAPAGQLQLGADGVVAALVRPRVTTDYRLAMGSVRAGLARVAVAPLLQVAATGRSLSGTIRPSLAGAPVALQRQDGASWTPVATSQTDATGDWSLAAPGPGAYRVRAAPGHGLVPAVSATLQVQ